MKQRLVILGAGIKGTALAALAALSGFEVHLVERGRVAAGATRANAGRLHLGTAGWREDAHALVARRRAGSELMRSLPDAVRGVQPAYYAFEDEGEAQDFQRFATSHELGLGPARRVSGHAWLDEAYARHVFEVPEFPFDPARLAGRFAQTCLNFGGVLHTGSRAVRVTQGPGGDRLVVQLDNGAQLPEALVVNTLARWSEDLELPHGAPRLDLEYWSWSILCVPAQLLAAGQALERVLVIMDRRHDIPSAIPHEQWIALDYKETHVQPIPAPDGDGSAQFRPAEPSHPADAANLATLTRAFRPVCELIERAGCGSVYSSFGTQARIRGVRRGSVSQILQSPQLPGYLLAFGGQASTALLDALELLQACQQRAAHSGGPSQPCRELARALAPQPCTQYEPMPAQQLAGA